MEIIKVQNLSFSYNKSQPILDDISFSINEGSFVSIIGHNGSGKSTLAKLLDGLIRLKSGEIIIDGEKLDDKTLKSIRRKIAIVFQNPDNQFIGATVEDDVAFGLENRNVPKSDMQKLVIDFLSKVGMLDKVTAEPSSLSGGQKQRVAIAGALILNPQILILDEATSMLDPKGKSDMQKLILKLRELNPKLTIISITHNIEETYYSDQIIVLDKGKIVFNSSPDKLYKNHEILDKYHIKTPFIFSFQKLLNENNIKIRESLTISEMCENLWQLK